MSNVNSATAAACFERRIASRRGGELARAAIAIDSRR
jgi:hypothetical protein